MAFDNEELTDTKLRYQYKQDPVIISFNRYDTVIRYVYFNTMSHLFPYSEKLQKRL